MVRKRLAVMPVQISVLLTSVFTVSLAASPDDGRAQSHSRSYAPSVVITWNSALLQAVRTVRFAPVFTARALAIAHTCMYDAWAAYDRTAVGTELGPRLRRPREERTVVKKREAVSFAAYRALLDLFPSEQAVFESLMADLGYDPLDTTTDTTTPAGVGNVACRAVLEVRHNDGSNQRGEVNGRAPYSDYTDYTPVNSPEPALVADPERWQPLLTPTGAPQVFLAPHWRFVKPFALTSADQFLPRPPAGHSGRPYFRQAEAIREISSRLTDREKVVAEYWADGPASETPPGHWNLLAQFVARRDRHDLDADVKLFFALGNALLDASIAVWDCKVAFDYVRPVSAVRLVFSGQQIEAWGGPFKGGCPVGC